MPWTLARGRVDVWCADTRAGTVAAATRARHLLSLAERARHERMTHPRARDHFLLGRVVLRLALSRYAAVHPAAWTFGAPPGRRPEIAAPATGVRLRFSVSHTDGCVACAVAAEDAVGVDVEAVSRPVHVGRMAARWFAAAEHAALALLPPAQRRRAFFALWTLKEAWVKARGDGLTVPLDRCAFDLRGGRVQARFAADAGDDAGWRFVLRHPGPRHVLAVALPRGGPVVVRVRRLDRHAWRAGVRWARDAPRPHSAPSF